uniref:Uncharacterized protein n=1 Tax=Anguilla anguilla TaxID=7936 RepID=A0A0E9XE32_ANGAN
MYVYFILKIGTGLI